MRKKIKVRVINSAKANENFTNVIINIYEKRLEQGRPLEEEIKK